MVSNSPPSAPRKCRPCCRQQIPRFRYAGYHNIFSIEMQAPAQTPDEPTQPRHRVNPQGRGAPTIETPEPRRNGGIASEAVKNRLRKEIGPHIRIRRQRSFPRLRIHISQYAVILNGSSRRPRLRNVRQASSHSYTYVPSVHRNWR